MTRIINLALLLVSLAGAAVAQGDSLIPKHVELPEQRNAAQREIDAVVLDVRKNFCEISAGSDDGVKVGMELNAYHEDRHVATVVIRKTDADRAIGERIPELSKGEIRKGDVVRPPKIPRLLEVDDGDKPFVGSAIILDVRKQYCEISVGAVYGVQVGQEFDVFRKDTFVTRLVILKTDPDRAVGEAIGFKVPLLKKGDTVRSRKPDPMPPVED